MIDNIQPIELTPQTEPAPLFRGKMFPVSKRLSSNNRLSRLSGDAIKIYLLLCRKRNKRHMEDLRIADSEIVEELGIERKNIPKPRAELESHSLITYEVHRGQRATYRVIFD